ncbi:MAG: sporulation protein YabP [Ruminococcaceae bacterium]|nr:sporulation protein YabP [Oscillospiraceae bacterium]
MMKSSHTLILDNRSKLTLTGVNDVLGFDEQNVNLLTDIGALIVKGEALHINKLSLESKDVCIDGKINSLQYLSQNTKSLKSKLFK